jgi:predicted Zn-dependent protease
MVQMGLTSYTEFMKENSLSTNQASTRSVETVGKNIARAVTTYLQKNGMGKQVENFKWEFKLVSDKTPNAFCLPGGKVVFYEGILPYTQSDAGMAVVMGHEIAHVVARHGNERMSQSLLAEFGGLALTMALETKPQQTKEIFQTAYGLGSQIGILLPYSRLHEHEADRLGLIFMAMAKYDPSEAVAFWERMKKVNGEAKAPEWLSTHPIDDTRIENMKKNLPLAKRLYQAALSSK